MNDVHALNLFLQNSERRVVVLERICIQQEQIINPLQKEVKRLQKQLHDLEKAKDAWNNLPWYQKLWVVAGV